MQRYEHKDCLLTDKTDIYISTGVLLKLLFVLATEHTLLRMFLNISRQILFPEDLHDAVL